MSADRINYLNIVLMALSALLALWIPFELFLLSYAILGPLHYLTEISWLHQRQYFTKNKNDYLVLGAICLVLTFFFIGMEKIRDAMLLTEFQKLAQPGAFLCLFIGFGLALLLMLFKEIKHRLFGVAALIIAALLLKDRITAQIIFTVFLPTLIHVFIFTGAFVLYGALKARSISGLVQSGAFLIFPVLLWLFPTFAVGHTLDDSIIKTYFDDKGRGLGSLNILTMQTLGMNRPQSINEVFYTPAGVLTGRLIAYAYTYHYLNWFSKTSIIGWHKVSKPRLAAVIAFWLASILLYAINYRTGLVALYVLSTLHVFLEFPLNHLSFVGIGQELKNIYQTGKFAHAITTESR